MPICVQCKQDFRYDDEVGYSKDLCGPMCDGIRHGHSRAIREMRSLASQLRLKADENGESDAALAFEASASSIERVCDELSA